MAKTRIIKKSKQAKNTKLSHQRIKNTTRMDSLMKLNHFIANGYVTTFILLVFSAVIFFGMTYLCNVFLQLLYQMIRLKDNFSGFNLSYDLGLHNCIDYVGSPWYYIILIGFLLIWDVKIFYQIQTSYRDINKNQKGSERWATLEEIKAQYKAIPMRAETVTEEFEGKGGVPVCHYEGKIYIDDEPVNNLYVGITRSGKGEMFVFSLIDIYSRAKIKASMIISDPKLELAAASYDTLIARGYEVHILNLIEEYDSMGYNPLATIVSAYASGDIATAETLCHSFSYSLFNKMDESKGENAYFYDNAVFMLSALILAHTDDCIALDKQENAKRKLQYDAGLKKFHELTETAQTQILEKFDKLKMLRNKIKTVDLPEHKRIMTAINDLQKEVEEITDPREDFVETHENQKKINMYSIINTFRELNLIKIDPEGRETMLDVYFNSRPDFDRAKLLFASVGSAGGERSKGNIYSTMLTKLQAFTYEKLAKMTAESTLNLEDIGYGDKPIAIFMGIPDFDHSKDFLVSTFISQTTFVLEKRASLSPSGKCDREVIYILDEFGNIPAIEAMDSLVTVCLGRNIRFNLIVQSYSQIEALYGDKANTIIGNCGNQIYIQSNDKSTTELFSALIGNETITDVNRIGGKMSLNKSFTEIATEKPLINPNQLQDLMVGECIIKRVMKRKDLKGNDVPPYPLKNTGSFKFPFRYMYLYDYFPSGKAVSAITKERRNHISHTERIFDVKSYIEKMTTSETNILTPVERQQRWDFIKDIYLSDLIAKPCLADSPKEILPTETPANIANIQQINKKMAKYQWSSEETLNFYRKNPIAFDLDEEQFLECSPAEVRLYLQDKNPPLSVGFYNVVTESFLLLPNSKDGREEEPGKFFQEEQEMDGAEEMIRKLERYRQDDTRIDQLPNCRKIADLIYKMADKEALMENDVYSVVDIYDFSLKSIFQSGFIPEKKQKYLVYALEEGRKDVVYE